MVFVAGDFIAGLAGALISPMLSVDPYIGNIFLVRSFFVVIVGGIGQVLGGTLIGSFLIGGSETLFDYSPDRWSPRPSSSRSRSLFCDSDRPGSCGHDERGKSHDLGQDEVAGERPALFRDDRRRRHLCLLAVRQRSMTPLPRFLPSTKFTICYAVWGTGTWTKDGYTIPRAGFGSCIGLRTGRISSSSPSRKSATSAARASRWPADCEPCWRTLSRRCPKAAPTCCAGN